MLKFKTVGILMALCPLMIVMLGCDEADEEGMDGLQESQLHGAWENVSFENYQTIESNIDQDMVLMFSPGIGSIEVSGDLTASLTYLYSWGDAGNYMVFVGNNLLGIENLPSYQVSINVVQGMASSLSMEVTLEDYSQHNFQIDSIAVLYNQNTLQLNILETQLVADDSVTTVSIGGQLEPKQLSLLANEITTVNVFEGFQFAELSEGVTTFHADNSFETISTLWAGAEPDTSLGTWSLNGSELTMVVENDEGYQQITVAEASIVEDELTLVIRGGCADESDVAGCLQQVEEFLGMTQGTLVSFEDVYTQVLHRIN